MLVLLLLFGVVFDSALVFVCYVDFPVAVADVFACDVVFVFVFAFDVDDACEGGHTCVRACACACASAAPATCEGGRMGARISFLFFLLNKICLGYCKFVFILLKKQSVFPLFFWLIFSVSLNVMIAYLVQFQFPLFICLFSFFLKREKRKRTQKWNVLWSTTNHRLCSVKMLSEGKENKSGERKITSRKR